MDERHKSCDSDGQLLWTNVTKAVTAMVNYCGRTSQTCDSDGGQLLWTNVTKAVTAMVNYCG